MLPGDAMYPEPYFYVNASPAPRPDKLTAPLDGGGVWNTEEWTGAILIGSRLDPDGHVQAAQVRAFLESASDACARLLRD
jgi:hypothetical protein